MNSRMRKQTFSPTTAQQLGSLIKSARDIMRKDKGLSGDLDRLPMLTFTPVYGRFREAVIGPAFTPGFA